jgi:hypothetical protein
MQNALPPPQLSPAAAQPLSDVLKRVLDGAAPPLVPGENEDQYARVAACIVAGARPRDAIEEFLTRDVIDLTWDILRLRRTKAGILKVSMNRGVEAVMDRLSYGNSPNFGYTRELGQRWAAGEKSAKKELARALSGSGTVSRRRDGDGV